MICHKDLTKRETSNQAIKRYQLKQAIKGYQLNQLDQRSYDPHEKDIMIRAEDCSKETREAPHDLCTSRIFVFGYKVHKIGS